MNAVEQVRAALGRIAAGDVEINAVTKVLERRALARAEAIDRAVASGATPGPLWGVPFLAKNLYDVEGVVTRAGSKATDGDPPARADAEAIRRLEGAGAVLVGLTNMDEFAYGFLTVNEHDGPARNPHDTARLAGGSSGGSAAAVAAGFVPLALGSDTNGSVRVPAALCGIFGIRPTFGRLSKHGAFPLSYTLDTVGPLARSAAELTVAFEALAAGHVRPAGSIEGLRIARLGGYFEHPLSAEARAALEELCATLGVRERVELPEVQRAREAAFLITAAEAGQIHLARLRRRASDYGDPVRERLIAAALTPSAWYVQALRFQRWFMEAVRAVFERYDVLVAPATPYSAPEIGEAEVEVEGLKLEAGPGLGTFTQPLALARVPEVLVPVRRSGALPVGVQLVGRWGSDELLLALARKLAGEAAYAQ